MGFPGGSGETKTLPANAGVPSMGWEEPLEEKKATQSSILA